MADVKFIDKEHLDSLERYGYCAFILTKQERECFHPAIGDQVQFLLDDSTRGRRVLARLVADQEMPDGGCVSLYSAACSVYYNERV